MKRSVADTKELQVPVSHNPKLHLTGHETCTRSFETLRDSSCVTAAPHCGQGQAVLAACTPSAGVTGRIHQLVLPHFFPQLGLGAIHEILC